MSAHDADGDESQERKPLAKGLLQLCGCIVAVWFFCFVFTPFWVSHSKVHQDFMAAVEDMGVPTTATYYNDIPFINEAYIMLLDTWRFLPRDMADKRRSAERR